jgi:uncharacterized protein with PQ loop repeat
MLVFIAEDTTVIKVLSLNSRAWQASFLNVLAMALQLFTLCTTKNIGGISLGMLGIFLYVQVTFAQVGHRDKSWALFWGMAASALLTTTIIIFVLYLRFVSPR